MMDWSTVNFMMNKPRKLIRDYGWGTRLFVKLSLPLMFCMVCVHAVPVCPCRCGVWNP